MELARLYPSGWEAFKLGLKREQEPSGPAQA